MLVSSLCRSYALCFGSLRHSPAAVLRRGHFGASFSAIRPTGRKLRSPSLGGLRAAAEGLKIASGRQVGARCMSGSTGSMSAVVPVVDKNGEVELLPAVEDRYEGVIVEVTAPMDPGAFVSSLRASLLVWRQQKKKGVWIKLPIQHSNLVHPTVQEGFWYHHAEPGYIMLVYWIPSTEHTLPINASHRVGAGGLVMNDKKEVLVVQEKSGMLRGKAIWKLPTGVVDQGEDIIAGAVREVKEETGIDAEFVEVLAFRQSHKSFFDKSDLFFVCLLRPISFDIKIQESEIEAAQWMPLEEFAAQPSVHKHELLKYIADIASAKFERSYTGFSPVRISSIFSNRQACLYVNSKDLNQTPSSGSQAPSGWCLYSGICSGRTSRI
ncbi:hypothetical protein Taro_025057 [Colocasia esculenta]|uniref:Nudix hydrolase domain-containing protein n=1 Tax=Colocasia esculenta TaxID=4460 RepID=A0A843VJD0_COLES|nr:hypothetical protein [Colocasia esculenta]